MGKEQLGDKSDKPLDDTIKRVHMGRLKWEFQNLLRVLRENLSDEDFKRFVRLVLEPYGLGPDIIAGGRLDDTDCYILPMIINDALAGGFYPDPTAVLRQQD